MIFEIVNDKFLSKYHKLPDRRSHSKAQAIIDKMRTMSVGQVAWVSRKDWDKEVGLKHFGKKWFGQNFMTAMKKGAPSLKDFAEKEFIVSEFAEHPQSEVPAGFTITRTE